MTQKFDINPGQKRKIFVWPPPTVKRIGNPALQPIYWTSPQKGCNFVNAPDNSLKH